MPESITGPAGEEGSAAQRPQPAESDPSGTLPPDEEDDELGTPLPEAVRRRVVVLAGDTFADLRFAELPAALRQYARFTPARRTKYGASAIAAALETDPVFRQRVATRFRAEQPDLAEALTAGSPPPAAEPVEVAAGAYLLRPPDWVKLVTAAGEQTERLVASQVTAELEQEVRDLREEVSRQRGASRSDTERLRAEVEEARKDADGVRRKLRSAQSDVRRGEAALRKLRGELEESLSQAAAARAALEAEARRLRSRLAEAENALEASRKAAREGKSTEDMRLRLLLDTILDASSGLRRELALPPAEFRPAETVEAVEPGRLTHRDIAQRALASDDPALLDQLLALPQAHLVVDGYNVTKTGYPTMPLDKQRLRLLGGLAVLAAQSAAEVTCVFDGADLDLPVLLAPPRGVRVLFSKSGQTADELIRQLVRAEPPGRPVTVVSTDREVADGVARAGARPVTAVTLLKRLARS